MDIDELERALREHTGEFLCRRMHDEGTTKRVSFAHVVTPPLSSATVPAIGRLNDLYARVGSVLLYHDAESGDAARYLAPPAEWAALHACFRDWVDDEEEDLLPDWLENALVIGETPRSGNYILMPAEGDLAGRVFEFDHDGLEFTHIADDVLAYLVTWLEPDARRLRDMASHMRFSTDGWQTQWWITRLQDNFGRVLHND